MKREPTDSLVKEPLFMVYLTAEDDRIHEPTFPEKKQVQFYCLQSWVGTYLFQ